MNTKEQVFKWARSHSEMSTFEWPTKILKGGPDKGKMRHQPICYDICDSFVMALFGADILKKEDWDITNT